MISLRHVSKSYAQFQAINSISLTVNKGEIFGIIGPSGAGKSTLLRLMNVLEMPDQGEVVVNGQQLTSLSHAELRKARQSIGMIFQHFNLLGNKTVYSNVAIPLELTGYSKNERQARVKECLAFVGLEHAAHQYPAQLSGGQKQRVAIARALANHPQVLLCDEPTSSLDSSTTAEVLHVLHKINQELGVTIVIVSHEMEVIKSLCHRVAVISDGELYETVVNEPTGIVQHEKTPQSFVQKLKERGASHNS